MSLRVAGYVVIGGTTPSEDPVTTGYIWMDTANNKLKICTSVAPYTFVEISGAGGASAWGDITGTLSNQTDLQAALDAKESLVNKDAPNGYAGLDGSGQILSTVIPVMNVSNLTGPTSALVGFDSVGVEESVVVASPITLTDGTPMSLGFTSSAVKLDDLGAPDDNTDLNASTSKHGLMQKYPNTTDTVLRGDGAFTTAFVKDGSAPIWSWSAYGLVQTFFIAVRALGSLAAPRRVVASSQLLTIEAFGYAAASDIVDAAADSHECAKIEFQATESHTTAAHGGKIIVATTPNGSSAVPSTRWTFDQDGALTPTAPAYLNVKLDDLIATDDNTDLNASASAHGLLKKLSGTATEFLDGSGAWDTIKGTDLVLTDVTTNDASASAHGFMQKYPGGTTTFLRADGSFASPTATPPVLVGPTNLVSTVEAIAANTFVHVGRQLEIAATGSIEIPSTSTLEITP